MGLSPTDMTKLIAMLLIRLAFPGSPKGASLRALPFVLVAAEICGKLFSRNLSACGSKCYYMKASMGEKPHDLRIAWSHAKQNIIRDGAVVWRRVSGLLSNMVAKLYLIGWKHFTFSDWLAPNGDMWCLPNNFLFAPSYS